MTGWLGQVPLLQSRNERRAPSPFLGSARLVPRYELGRPVRHSLGEVLCCSTPDGGAYCFDSSTGECVVTWVSASGAPSGSPACVKSAKGEWIHPKCPSAVPPVAQVMPEPVKTNDYTPYPATETPVLPRAARTTTETPMTGAYPGNPFGATPAVHVAQTPAPLPAACPVGPVPLRQYFEGCMGVPRS